MTATASQMQGETPESVLSAPISYCEAENAVATPLSFSRAAISRLFSRRCHLEKLRLELDAHGRGEVLYRFGIDEHVFHFFVLSQELAEDQKLDRNFAASWDAMGVLCEGEWTAGREEYLRRQIPLQRGGRADYDTLIYARGNRSGRLFSFVVDALAHGRQPEPALLTQVGYIMRTTAFIGNGQLGTRQLAGFAEDHPLRAPYHAQMVSGFLFREFNFDLVDAMAAQRSPDAVRLATPMRRFLGLGNSAATGLVPFLAAHSCLIADWISAEREALKEMRDRVPIQDETAELKRLIARVAAHLREGARPDDGVFKPDNRLAEELETLLQRIPAQPVSWRWLREQASTLGSSGAATIIDALILELGAGSFQQSARTCHINERHRVRPCVSTHSFLKMLRAEYQWALAAAAQKDAAHFFWYRAASAPRDLRRGVRGRVPDIEYETPMDWILRLAGLVVSLEGAEDMPLADFLLAHPQFKAVVARLQSEPVTQAGELAVNFCSADYIPFATIRQVLAIFGLDKLEAAFPKSVRGTFLQGAPIAEDLGAEASVNANWPFPLAPSDAEISAAPQLPPYRATSFIAPTAAGFLSETEEVVASPIELERNLASAMQANGMELGLANEAARLATLAVSARPGALDALTREILSPQFARGTTARLRGDAANPLVVVDAYGAHPLAVLPLAHDIARDRAQRHGAGVALIESCGDSSVKGALAKALMIERRTLSFVRSHTDDGVPAEIRSCLPPELEKLLATRRSDAHDLSILCVAPNVWSALPKSAMAAWSKRYRALHNLEQETLQRGIRMTKTALMDLERAAARLFITAEIEQKLRDEIIDPLKMF